MRIGSASSSRASRVLVVAAALATASLGGCGGDDQPAAAQATSDEDAPATADASAATSASSKGNSWPDYMVLRNGYTCTAEAKVGAVRSTGTFATRDVRRENGLVSFVIETTSSLENATTPPVKTRAHYREQKDGSLAVEMPSPTIPGFATTVDGEMHMPSISSVRSGKSASGEMTMTMTPTSSTLRDQIQPMLASGARGIEMHLKVRVGAAPEKREIRSGGKTYTDLVGIKNEFVAAEITNAKDSSLKAAFGQLRDGFLKNKTETYYARGAGQIQTVAMGIPVTVTGCKG